MITGGGGFIGSHLADRLGAADYQVVVVDNFATGRRDNVTERPGLRLIEGDIADPAALDGAFAATGPPDVVVHAAASYKDPQDWAQDVRTNALGTANVVKATQAAGCERLIYFQTALCYGTMPLEQPISLAHPIRPDSSYAISKTAGEQYIQMSGLDWVSLRLANAYGPRNISGPLPTFFQRLTTDKPVFVMDTRRDFVFVDDLIDLVWDAVVEGRGHGVYHASSGSDHAIKELLDATLAAIDIQLDEEVEVRPRAEDDAYTILLDPSRVQEEFGWTPKTPLADGVAQAIAYYRSNGVTETFTHLKVPTQ